MERERAEQIFLLAAIAILGFLGFLMFKPFLDWVILGFLFAYLFYGPYLRVKRRLKRSGAAAGVMLTVVLIVIFLPFVVIFAMLLGDVQEFSSLVVSINIEDTVENVLNQTALAMGVTIESDTLQSVAKDVSTALRDNAASFFGDLAKGLFQFATMLLLGLFLFGFTVFYGLVDGPRMLEGVLNLIPLRRPEKTDLLLEIKRVTDAVFVGHILISFIQAAVGTLGFILLGVPRSVFWGFTMLIAALIPVIGPFIVWVPVGLYMVLTPGPVESILPFIEDRRAVGLGILFVVGPVVSTIDNIVRPKVVGRRANVHPFMVLIGALGGLFVFGFTGFVVGPLVLSLLLAVLTVYRKHWTGEAHHLPVRRVDALIEASELPPRADSPAAPGAPGEASAPPKP